MSDLGNIGNFGQPNYVGTTQTTSTTGAGDSTTQAPDNTKSTLTKSQELAEELLTSANAPYLVQPGFFPINFNDFYNNLSQSNTNSISAISGTAGGASVLLNTALAIEQIGLGILEAWNKSIEEDKERVEQERNSPAYLSWLAAQSAAVQQQIQYQDDLDSAIKSSTAYQQWLTTLTPSEKADEISREGLFQSYNNYQNSIANLASGISGYVQDKFVDGSTVSPVNDLLQLATLTQGLVVAGAFMATVPLVETSQNTPLGVNPVNDAVRQIMPQGPDQSTIAMFAINFFAVPLMDLATAENLAKSKGTGSKPTDLNTAKNFAAEVINLVTNPELLNVAMAIFIAKMEANQPMSAQQKATFSTQLKIILLSVALALMYKTELKDAGKITDIEFSGLLTGGISIAKGDIKGKLVSLIMANINDLPDSVKVAFLNNVLAYMDSNPSVENLLNPQHAVDTIFAQAPDEPPKKA